MILHLFKLIWNRKRANALVISEIFVCFLVLFAVVDQGIYTINNYRRPLGFDYAHVSAVRATFDDRRGSEQPKGSSPDSSAAPAPANPHEARQRALLDLVKADPMVENAAWASPLPFSQSHESRSVRFRKRPIRYQMARCTDEYKDVMKVEITSGRWFSAEDDGREYEALVITEALAKEAFGDEDPVGKSLVSDTEEKGDPLPDKRVVGVMRAFRQEGELDAERFYALSRLSYASAPMRHTGGMAVRLKAGADATVEARITAALQAAAPDWSFGMTTLDEGAEFNRKTFAAPVFLVGIIASFLILMVALGLSGVVWLSVTRRIREIGVRRAMGATAGDIRLQVVGELLVMATLAMAAGVVVVLQFPFLDLLGPIPKSVFFGGLSLTIVSLYTLALVCAWQPARLATTVHPAEALRYE